jgi:hypothetical protein
MSTNRSGKLVTLTVKGPKRHPPELAQPRKYTWDDGQRLLKRERARVRFLYNKLIEWRDICLGEVLTGQMSVGAVRYRWVMLNMEEIWPWLRKPPAARKKKSRS